MIKNKYVSRTARISLVILAAVAYAFFFKVIVEGRGFLAMGVSGIAVILSRSIGAWVDKVNIESILYMIFNLAINLPLLIFGYKKISKKALSPILLIVISAVLGIILYSL